MNKWTPDPEDHTDFDLNEYDPPHDSTMDEYMDFVESACGCSDQQKEDTDKKIQEQRRQLQQKIFKYHGYDTRTMRVLGFPVPIKAIRAVTRLRAA